MLVTMMLCLLAVFALAEDGTVHLLYSNGAVSENEGTLYYEFDVQAWISEGSDVLSDGMVYVKYPVTVFGNMLAYNEKVTVEKTGVLALTEPVYGMDLYYIVNTNDTYADVFAVTFSATFAGAASYKEYHEAISTDPGNPSDLLHIVMEVAENGSGTVFFPGNIPGLDELYWDYEYETFSGGLDISAAMEDVNILATDDPIEPTPEGYVELQSFTASIKKSDVNLNWITLSEKDNAGFVIKRSQNGSDYVIIASYTTNSALEGQLDATKRTRYSYTDKGIASGVTYSYMLESVDIYGNVSAYNSVSVGSEAAEEISNPGKGRKKVMIAEDYSVEAAYPNPFNPRFIVPFELNSTQQINVTLYDITGKVVREVAAGSYQAGYYELEVESSDLGSGTYLLATRIGSELSVQRMTLLK